MVSVKNYFEQPKDASGTDNKLVIDGSINANGQDFTSNDMRQALASSSSVVSVSSLGDFPAPVNNVITLEDNTAYLIDGDVGIGNNRIVGGLNSTIFGYSPEICYLHNTLDGVALVTSSETIAFYRISLYTSGTGASILDLDASTSLQNNSAIDWQFVNFSGGDIGTIANYDNCIFNTIGVIDKTADGFPALGDGFVFDGTIGTIGFVDTLFNASGSGNNGILLADTLTITRRFRVSSSSFLSFSSASSLNVAAGATIPNEGCILDNVNFGGSGGVALSGIDFMSDKARFFGCRGIKNTYAAAQYSMLNNATATTINTIGTAEKVAGTTTLSSVSNFFTQVSNNEVEYTGSLSRLANIDVTASLISGNNNKIGLYIAKNGTPIVESENYENTDAGGRLSFISAQVLDDMAEGDRYSVYVENDTSTTNVTVENLNFKLVT